MRFSFPMGCLNDRLLMLLACHIGTSIAPRAWRSRESSLDAVGLSAGPFDRSTALTTTGESSLEKSSFQSATVVWLLLSCLRIRSMQPAYGLAED